MDIRSFALNFEVNAVIYSARTTMRLQEAFENDISKEHAGDQKSIQAAQSYDPYQGAVLQIIVACSVIF